MTQSPQSQFNAQYVTTQEVCDILGISRQWYNKLVHDGSVPPPIQVRSRPEYRNPTICLYRRKDIEPRLPEIQSMIESRRK